MEEKLLKTVRDWCKWNRNELSGDDFAHNFRKTFKKETAEIWDEEEWFKLPAQRVGVVKPLRDMIDHFGGHQPERGEL